MDGVLRVATRGSDLARWQARYVAGRLAAAHPGLGVELVIVETGGDRRIDVPVWDLGGQGVFVKEVQAAVLEGRADVAVHSAKDLPSTTLASLALAAIPSRGDPRDCLVGSRLAALGPGAPVATGSVRRRAQLAWLRPDLTFQSLRGNIATRLERVPPGGAVVVAAAALARLGLMPEAAEVLSPEIMTPQAGQGAIGVECRAGDELTRRRLAAIDDPASRTAVEAERAFLARLGGGCDIPVGAHARLVTRGDRRGPAGAGAGVPGGEEPVLDAAELVLDAVLASPDGRVLLRESRRGPAADPRGLGAAVAEVLLRAGGASLLPGTADAGGAAGAAGAGAGDDPVGTPGAARRP